MKTTLKPPYPYPLGVFPLETGIRFSFVSGEADCGILIYRRGSGELLQKCPADPAGALGDVRSGVADVEIQEISYAFYEKDRVFADPYARAFEKGGEYGALRREDELRALVPAAAYDWGQEERPLLSYQESVGYCLHVRGFTRHPSAHVKGPGTFCGIREKIPYLKELGITTLELQPAYEFLEREAPREQGILPEEPKLNYWGYKKGFYYAPKQAYARGKDAGLELRDLVRELHENKMELVMQFYFPREVPRDQIGEILRFWRWEYHVDGFRLMGEGLPVRELALDSALTDTKLWCEGFPQDEIYGYAETPSYRRLGIYNDGFLYHMRRFLKGDEGTLQEAMNYMRRNPGKFGCVNYLTNFGGFTLWDLVSYDRKHNEANGEDNRDGSDQNLSWNCGAEGPSRKRQVLSLRKRQVRNALALLFLSQGMPLLFMGDEFGNSQGGNNNPYCQDNPTSWLNWGDLKRNREQYEYVKRLIELRRANPVFCMDREPRLMDYRGYGCPDLSYHGSEAWKVRWDAYCRYVGVLLCGAYGREGDGTLWYLGINMHWEPHEFALPAPAKDCVWEKYLTTWGEKEGRMAEGPLEMSVEKS